MKILVNILMKFNIILISLATFIFSYVISLNLSQRSKINTNEEEIKDKGLEENSENLRKNSQLVIMDTDVSTLVEVPVTYNTGISYYYPYFYKTKLISFADDTNSFFNKMGGSNSNTDLNTNTNNTCSDRCEICNTKDSAKCSKCVTGFYLNNGKCLDYCPEGMIADILRNKCMNVTSDQAFDLLYSKAYSLGSCSNMCGKIVQDCSCAPSCKSKGTCCTDYDVVNCDLIFEKASKEKVSNCSSGCELCEKVNNNSIGNNNSRNSTKNSFKCNQCSDDTFYLNGKCVHACSEGFTADNINRICIKNENSKLFSLIL
jgi:hypothetical protein